MKKVGFVTYRQAPNLTADDALALDPLKQFGIETIPVIWNATKVDWQSFDAVILRSCRDYHHQPQEFRHWIDHLDELQVTIWNPVPIIRWNMDKKYSSDLAAEGVAIPPTVWLEKGAAADLPTLLRENDFERAVIKPTISATAHRTWRTSLDKAQQDQHKLDVILSASGAMVQKFADKAITNGEWSLLFLDGKYSHAVLKRPKEGDFRVQSDFGGTSTPQIPSPALLEQAEAIVRLIKSPLLCARVDGIDNDGQFVLLELELIEPELFLRLDPLAPRRFDAAIAAIP
jgi:glutathione synthase/RimK-type ligase-like ATP-grasp enzyme